jgi:hypothetical protein
MPSPDGNGEEHIGGRETFSSDSYCKKQILKILPAEAGAGAIFPHAGSIRVARDETKPGFYTRIELEHVSCVTGSIGPARKAEGDGLVSLRVLG